MTPNELLLWLSARKEGSWPQFRGAVEMLDLANDSELDDQDNSLPIHQRVRFNLERLGHVEFDAGECENGWRVVPPTLALSPHGGGVTGVLCGARTPALLNRIKRDIGALSLDVSTYEDCPDIFRIYAAETEILVEFANSIALVCQCDSPSALLAHIPSINGLNGWPREELPHVGKDWEVKEFVVERKVIKWRETTLEAANARTAQGLFSVTRFQMAQYFLRVGRETIRVPGQIGKYEIFFRRQRRVLKYDRNKQCLSMRAICRPPLLTERALILCSGFPPTLSNVYGRSILTYRNISEEVAGMVAEVLRQDLS